MKPEIIPKRPGCPGWNRRRIDSPSPQGFPTEAWLHVSGLLVISSLEAHPPREGGLQYHVSVSKLSGRCEDMEVLRALADFDLLWAKELNLVLGLGRHFWQSAAPHPDGIEAVSEKEAGGDA
jgi:hypothetical protein